MSLQPTRLLLALSLVIFIARPGSPAEPAATVIVPLERMTVPAGPSPSTVTLDVHASRAALLTAARAEGGVVLQLNDVEADRSPGVSYQVFVGLPRDAKADPSGPFFAGNLTLYSAGIRSEARGECHPASFRFRIEKQLIESLRGDTRSVLIRFVPQGDALVPVRILSPAIVRNP